MASGQQQDPQSTTNDSRAFYNISQLRNHLWEQLKLAADGLAQAGLEGEDVHETTDEVADLLTRLRQIERYWAYPGAATVDFMINALQKREFGTLAHRTAQCIRGQASKSYRTRRMDLSREFDWEDDEAAETADPDSDVHYFEVLLVGDLSDSETKELRKSISEVSGPRDQFCYNVVIVPSFRDAMVAVLFNTNIQSVVIRYGFPYESDFSTDLIAPFLPAPAIDPQHGFVESEAGPLLGETIRSFRPELDLFFVTDTPLDQIDASVHGLFRRIFYRTEDVQELDLSIKRWIQERYQSPFFTALKNYSQQPTSVFHAMPASRGNSVFRSHWIKDLGEFYGRNIFLAETSATTGGLDSLLQPKGPLKKAQELAARAFGSKQTFFVTNGTSTANKIVLQALARPGDAILIDRDCHKSHHYALVLSGAHPVYLDSFQIERYSMYGAVGLEEITEKLLTFRAAGRLDRIKMLVLTNCTFDGMVYNVQRVMEQVLAIKPDMVFLWDEAWFGFAAFNHVFRQRTAMHAASVLTRKYASPEYREEYEAHIAGLRNGELPQLPDPDKVRIRVYATQSTHKTLTSLRQGSMIHVHDVDFRRRVEDAFQEAYMTHTSTSPNYQILASLDAGRRQAELEGFELVENAIERAMYLRVKIASHPLLKKYFDILTSQDLIRTQYRQSGVRKYYDRDAGWSNLHDAWANDDFVLDPTKINLYIGRTGIDGDTFKNKYLMDQFGIQINKTSRNSVLFMTNIGTTRSSMAFLVGVLLKIAQQIEEDRQGFNVQEEIIHQRKVESLTEDLPALPDFSHFHRTFLLHPDTPEGHIRKAYFLAYETENCEYIKLEDCDATLAEGEELVSASFVIPYPPGFPVLVPGQVITRDILDFMQALDVKEIHSYRPELGLRIFNRNFIRQREERAKQKEREKLIQP